MTANDDTPSRGSDVPQKIPRYISLLILISALFFIATSVFSSYISRHIAEVLIPLLYASYEIRSESVYAHLWLEEKVIGDTAVHVDSIWQHVDSAKQYARVLMNGGIYKEYRLKPLHDSVVESNIICLQNDLDAFKEIARSRIALSTATDTADSVTTLQIAGSTLDKTIDSLFIHFNVHSITIEDLIHKYLRSRERIFLRIQFFLIVICLVLALFSGYITYTISNTRTMYIKQLQNLNHQLDASNQQLQANEQQLRAANQQLQAQEQQLKAENQQLTASEQQLKAVNQQLNAHEQQLKAANKQLTESERRYRSFVQNFKGIAYQGTIDWKPIFLHGAVTEITGYKEGEFIAGNPRWDMIIHPDDRKRIVETSEKIQNVAGFSCVREYRIIAKENNVRLIREYIQNIFDDSGKPVKIQGAIYDITEQKKMENELNRLAARNEAILGAVTDIIMEVDFNKVYTWANKAGYAFFGDDVIGKEAAYYFEGEQDTYDIVQPLFNGEEDIFYVESWQRRKDGEKRLLAWWCKNLKEADGTIIGALSTARDITDQRRLEEQLYQTRKMEAIGQLAGGIAHDFNNQLTGIMGYADLLRENLSNNKELFRYADMIVTATRRSADLTDQLLAFARKGKYLEVPVNIHRVIGEVVLLLEHSIDKKINIKQKLYANPPVTLGDPTQIQNALLNLGVNARDAMPEGGELIFTTNIVYLDEEYCAANPYDVKSGSYLQVSVTDSGIGMDESTIKHIFEPFFTTKETGKGTGMGLAAVYGTVKNHKGAINVYSELDFGTTFKIYLPLYDTSDPAAQEDKHTRKIIKGHARVMVVDDEKIILDLVSDMLESMNYSVVTAINGKDALAHYKKLWKDIDLVILDMVMPEMGGHETFIEMKKINPGVKALLSSGYSITGDAEKILDEGVLDFIQKPYQKADLSEKIAKALGIV